MKKWLLLFLLFAAVRLPAQGVSGNLTAQSTDCTATNACLSTDIAQNDGGATIKLSGTWVGTVDFEATADPLTVLPSAASWVAINATPSNSTTPATSATGDGAWQVNVSGYQRIRVRVNAYMSGTIAAAINLSTSSAKSGGGSGGGVASVSGTANEVSCSGTTSVTCGLANPIVTPGPETVTGSLEATDGSFGSGAIYEPVACETSFGPTTLSTVSTTTTTGVNCLPANTIILGVLYRITTTITTSANFTVGIAGTTSKFCGTQSTLTAGTTGVCAAQVNGGVMFNPSAAAVVVTTNANAGAGAIRLIVYGIALTPPTS